MLKLGDISETKSKISQKSCIEDLVITTNEHEITTYVLI